MLNGFDKVLVLAPHTDDGELGCGGLINKLSILGKEVYYVAFSICEESVPEGFPKDVLGKEVLKATKVLGIKEQNVIVKNYKVRLFTEKRQEILEGLVKLNKDLNPDLVLCPSSFDVHQDHQTINNEAKRAFKKTTIWGYDFVWNNYEFKPTNFVTLSEENLNVKIDSLKEYNSQGFRLYTSEKSIKTMASYRGLQIGVEYAEAFENIRTIIK